MHARISSRTVRHSQLPRPEPVPLVSEADLINPLLRVADIMNTSAATCNASTPLVEALRVLRQSDTAQFRSSNEGGLSAFSPIMA